MPKKMKKRIARIVKEIPVNKEGPLIKAIRIARWIAEMDKTEREMAMCLLSKFEWDNK